MNKKNIIVVKQDVTGQFVEYSMDPVARFDNMEDAQRLIQAKQIAYDLEIQASNLEPRYKFFAVHEIDVEAVEYWDEAKARIDNTLDVMDHLSGKK
tara:strand:+ start:453 stop:740 length:288 start_codon:yes stop_codon:yes gene_type:complete